MKRQEKFYNGRGSQIARKTAFKNASELGRCVVALIFHIKTDEATRIEVNYSRVRIEN